MGRLLLAAVVVAFAIPASTASAARAGPADTAPEAWATRVCGTLVDWQKQIIQGGQALGKSLGNASPARIKAKLVDYLAMAVRISKTLVRRIDEAGTPAVDHGSEIRSMFHAALVSVPKIFEQARAQIAALRASDPVQLAKGAQTVGDRLSRAGDAIQTTFDRIDKRFPSKRLAKAFDKTAACQSIR